MIKSNIFSSIYKVLLSILICFVLTACGSSSGEQAHEQNQGASPEASEPDNNQENTDLQEESSFAGRVVKGVISNAVIKVYPIINDQGSYRIDTNATPITTRTNSSGYYQVKPSKGKKDFYYYLEVVTDENSQMLCDLDTGCLSSTGAMADFGDAFTLATGFTLSNVVKSKAGKINHAPISPLTHLATQYTQTLSGGFSPENISTAKRFIEAKFEFADRALELTPADLTALSEVRKLKSQELKLGLISASFMPYIENPDWDNLATLPMSDLLLTASQLAQFLANSGLSTQSSNTLAALEEETFIQYSKLTVTPLVISDHPASTTAIEGDNVQLTVIANSSEAISYQWLKGGAEIEHEITSTLDFTNIVLEAAGEYSVRVSTASESKESLSALISVSPAPKAVLIVSQPQSVVATEGDDIYLEVSAEGDGPLVYQWQKGGSILVNETSKRLNLSPLSLSDAGTYRAIVSNNINLVESDFADIAVLEAIEALAILQQPVDVDINEGNAASFSVTASGGGFISYQWRKNALAIEGAYTASYTINSTNIDDAGTYDVVVTNSVGNLRSQSASLNIIPNIVPIILLQQPQDVSVNENESVTLFVSASSEDLLTYQWLKNGIPLSNVNTAYLTISNANLEDQASYEVIVSNDSSMLRSNAAYISVITAPIETPVAVTLTWEMPDLRVDGSPLLPSEIQGYEIIYGASLAGLDQSLSVTNAETLMTTINLLPGSYYFKIATVEATDIQGDFSQPIQITLQ